MIRRSTVTILLLAALGGCGGDPGGGSVREQSGALAERPSIEAITASYEEMQVRIRERLSAEVGSLEWVNKDDEDTGGCGFDFQDVEGATSRSLDGWRAKGNLPDAQWDRAVAIVAEVTSRYGYEQPRTIVDRPSDHEIRVSDPYGGELIFGTAVNTTLRVNTGCHLSTDAVTSGG